MKAKSSKVRQRDLSSRIRRTAIARPRKKKMLKRTTHMKKMMHMKNTAKPRRNLNFQRKSVKSRMIKRRGNKIRRRKKRTNSTLISYPSNTSLSELRSILNPSTKNSCLESGEDALKSLRSTSRTKLLFLISQNQF